MAASTTCKQVICNSVLKSMLFVTSLNCVVYFWKSLHSFLTLIHYWNTNSELLELIPGKLLSRFNPDSFFFSKSLQKKTVKAREALEKWGKTISKPTFSSIVCPFRLEFQVCLSPGTPALRLQSPWSPLWRNDLRSRHRYLSALKLKSQRLLGATAQKHSFF